MKKELKAIQNDSTQVIIFASDRMYFQTLDLRKESLRDKPTLVGIVRYQDGRFMYNETASYFDLDSIRTMFPSLKKDEYQPLSTRRMKSYKTFLFSEQPIEEEELLKFLIFCKKNFSVKLMSESNLMDNLLSESNKNIAQEYRELSNLVYSNVHPHQAMSSHQVRKSRKVNWPNFIVHNGDYNIYTITSSKQTMKVENNRVVINNDTMISPSTLIYSRTFGRMEGSYGMGSITKEQVNILFENFPKLLEKAAQFKKAILSTYGVMLDVKF